MYNENNNETGYQGSTQNDSNNGYQGSTQTNQQTGYQQSAYNTQQTNYQSVNSAYSYNDTNVTNQSNHNNIPPKQKKKKQGSGFEKKVAFCCLFGVIAGASFFAANKIDEKAFSGNGSKIIGDDNQKGLMSTKIVSGASITSASSVGVSSVVEEVLPSIVQINVTAKTQVPNFFGQDTEQEQKGSGSGIIMTKKKGEILIATNNHVVEDSTSVEVLFCDNEKVNATVKGTDSGSDLALISVKESDLKSETLAIIKTIQLGDSDSVKVGEQAIAIGNALGYGQSVTVGYISAKDREISAADYSMKLLQTDAAINPGNSGGALVNGNGQLIGINSAKYASEEVEGMGFAIPISKALPIINDLLDKESIPESEQAYLGIRGRDITSEYNKYYDLPIGIYVGEVVKDSPAEKCGLKKGYIITGINNRTVKTMEQMQEVLSGIRVGSKGTIKVMISENGKYKEKSLSITFGAKSEMNDDLNKKE